MKKIVLASSNKDKIVEIKSLFKNLNLELIPQTELKIEDADETGTTFFENAIIKARHAAKLSGLPAIADDSGLSVDYLHGAPGVYSARYAGKNATNNDRIQKLLTELKNAPEEKRTGSYHCVIALMRSADDPAPIICHGQWDGIILTELRGDKGFGYDPIFYIATHHCTVAEMDLTEKNRISHRGKAFKQLSEKLIAI